MSKSFDNKERMKAGLGGGLKPKAKAPSMFEPTTLPEEPGLPAEKEIIQITNHSVQGAVAAPGGEGELDQRITLPMTDNQRYILQNIERKCRNNKQKKAERITVNVAIRCLIDLLDKFDGDVSSVCSPNDLKQVFFEHIGTNYLKNRQH